MLATIDNNVLVALFAFLTAIITVALPQIRQGRRTEKHTMDIKDALGEKNGNGTAMQMVAKSMAAQYELLQRMQAHEDLDTSRFAALDSAVQAVSGQVAQAAQAAASAASAAASAASTAESLASVKAKKEDVQTPG